MEGPRGARSECWRQGQVWSFDYTVGFLLFLLTLLAVAVTLSRTVLLDDSFDEVEESANALSEALMSEGYPRYWRADDLVAIGLLTEDRLSLRKVERFAALAAADYDETRQLLNTPFEYAVTFENRSGHLRNIGTACSIGSGAVMENKFLTEENSSIAYYARAASPQELEDALLSFNATAYSEEELSTLLDALDEYDLVILEEPDLASLVPPYDGEKEAALDEYLRLGGTLLVIGNFNLSGAFGMNVTPINGSEEATGWAAEEPLLNLTGLDLENLTGWALKEGAQERYESLASLPDGRDLAARFAVGDGDLLYLGGLDGEIVGVDRTLKEQVIAALNATRRQAVADCQAITLPTGNAEQLVALRRLAASKGEVLTMTLYVWEER